MKKLALLYLFLHTATLIHTDPTDERIDPTRETRTGDSTTSDHQEEAHLANLRERRSALSDTQDNLSGQAANNLPDAPPTQPARFKQPDIDIADSDLSKSKPDITASDLSTRVQQEDTRAAQSTSSLENVFDFKAFAKEDKDRETARNNEDAEREKLWKTQDEEAKKLRDNESFAVRLFKKFSSDGAADEEIEKARNKVILDTNKARLFEDFEIKAKRFNEFKEKYSDFSAKKPFDGLLELTDMNSFVDKSYGERREMLNKIKASLDDEDALTQLTQDDMPALKDLVRLVNFHDPDETAISSKLRESIEQIPEGKQDEIKTQLINALRTTARESVVKLEKFNENMESIAQIKDLNDLRDMKAASVAGAVALGVAATGAMIAQPHLAGLAGFVVSTEGFAVGAKISLIINHVSGAREAELAVKIQNAVKEQFASIAPRGTKLIDAQEYKNEAKGIGTRLTEADQKFSNHDNAIIRHSYNATKAIASTPFKILGALSDGAKWLSDKTGFTKALSNGADNIKKLGSKAADLAKGAYKGARDTIMPKTKLREQYGNRYNKDGHLIDQNNNEVLYHGKPIEKGSAQKAYEKTRQDFTLSTSSEESKQPEQDNYKKESHVAKGINWVKNKIGLSPKPSAEPARTEPKTQAPAEQPQSLPKDSPIAEYAEEDAKIKQNRQEEDRLRQKLRDAEDKAHIKTREEQTWAERLFKRLTSDHAVDEEIEKSRNKTIVEINKQRLSEDFARKAKRFQKFADDNPEFSKKAPFDKLLELGDMNKFISMPEEDREKLLEDISNSVATSITQENANKFSAKALDDLINLINFHNPPGDKIPLETINEIKKLESSKDPQDQDIEKVKNLKETMAKALQDSLKINLERLQKFHTGMKNLESVNTLNELRKIRDTGTAASVVLGVATVGVMANHGDIALLHLTDMTEKIGVGAKMSFIIGEVAGSKEAILSRVVQDQIKNMFLDLSPTSTDLIDTQHYHNPAKGPMDRVSNSERFGGTYRNIRDAIKAPFQAAGWAGGKVAEGVKWVANTAGDTWLGRNIKESTEFKMKDAKQKIENLKRQLPGAAERETAQKAQHDKTRNEFSLVNPATAKG